MSAEDAWFLYFEKPDAPLHIGSVAVFEGDIPLEALRESMAARMHLIPRYRQRAVIPPFYAAHPTWEDDPEFSIDRHVRAIDLPAPGDDDQLRETASAIFAPMLPRDRPLWDITVVRGLAGGRTAYVSRVHHCLVDGVSGIDLLLAVLDLTPNPPPPAPPERPWEPSDISGPIEALTDAMFDRWAAGLRAWGEWLESAFDPRSQFRRASEVAHALEIALPLALRQAQPAPWNRPIGGERRVAWTSMSFADVRGIRSAVGGTVNDVMLTLLGGALGAFLRLHGAPTDGVTLRVQIPVNVRREDQKGALGNRVSMMLPELPVGIIDPVARLGAVREEMERLKAQEQANAFESLMSLSANLPATYHALAGSGGVPRGLLNLVCTNVPGPMIPLYSVGHHMVAHYPLVPLAGDLGIGVGITSFDQSLYVGIMADPKIVPDVGRIAQAFANEFNALRDAAGVEHADLPDLARPATNGANGAHANGTKPAARPRTARKRAGSRA
jgi:WS/DGAT/MGAT family acyltransferase